MLALERKKGPPLKEISYSMVLVFILLLEETVCLRSTRCMQGKKGGNVDRKRETFIPPFSLKEPKLAVFFPRLECTDPHRRDYRGESAILERVGSKS